MHFVGKVGELSRQLYSADTLNNLQNEITEGKRLNLAKAISSAQGTEYTSHYTDDFSAITINAGKHILTVDFPNELEMTLVKKV